MGQVLKVWQSLIMNSFEYYSPCKSDGIKGIWINYSLYGISILKSLYRNKSGIDCPSLKDSIYGVFELESVVLPAVGNNCISQETSGCDF